MTLLQAQAPKHTVFDPMPRLPLHWSWVPLKRVVSLIESGTSVNAYDWAASAGDIGVLKTSCVYRGYFEAAENKTVVAAEIDRVSCPVKAGRLIVSRMNTPDLVGAAGLVRENRQDLFLPDRLWQVTLGGVDPSFAYWWTRSAVYRQQVEAACTGTSASMKNLAQDQFGSFMFPLATSGDQVAIASFLDRETAKIDALVAEQERLIELLQEKRQAVVSNAVTKGLDPCAPTKPSGIEWLGDVPANWRVVALKRLIQTGTSISYGIVQPGEPLDCGVPFVQTADMTRGTFDLSELQKTDVEIAAQYPRSRLAGGEVILGIRASVGAAHVVPELLAGANLSRGVARIVPKPCLASKFLVAYLSGDATRHYWQLSKQGSTFSEVSIETVRELPVCVPPPGEQAKIAAALQAVSGQFDDLTAHANRLIGLARERRAALISAAVTGQIDVRNAFDRSPA